MKTMKMKNLQMHQVLILYLTEDKIDPNKTILCIAPGEDQKPIFTDEDTEYLCFPYNILWTKV